jgi:hypothetical protein
MDRVLLSTAETLDLSRACHKCAVYAPDFVTRIRVADALDVPEASGHKRLRRIFLLRSAP